MKTYEKAVCEVKTLIEIGEFNFSSVDCQAGLSTLELEKESF